MNRKPQEWRKPSAPLSPTALPRLAFATAVLLAATLPTQRAWGAQPAGYISRTGGTSSWNATGNWTPGTIPGNGNTTGAWFGPNTGQNLSPIVDLMVTVVAIDFGGGGWNIGQSGGNTLTLNGDSANNNDGVWDDGGSGYANTIAANINLFNAQTWLVSTGNTLTYSGVLGGGVAWTKTGGGTLNVTNGGNTFNGTITVAGGTMSLNGNGSLTAPAAPNNAQLSVQGGGTFVFDNSSNNINRLIGTPANFGVIRLLPEPRAPYGAC